MTTGVSSTENNAHDKHAPYWAIGLVLLGATGLATIWLDISPFWKGYVLELKGHSI